MGVGTSPVRIMRFRDLHFVISSTEVRSAWRRRKKSSYVLLKQMWIVRFDLGKIVENPIEM